MKKTYEKKNIKKIKRKFKKITRAQWDPRKCYVILCEITVTNKLECGWMPLCNPCVAFVYLDLDADLKREGGGGGGRRDPGIFFLFSFSFSKGKIFL